MSPGLIISIIAVYFVVLILIAYFTSRGADSNTFFIANRQAPWYLVAFGMIGTSISGVTFISVPGTVGIFSGGQLQAFSYFQIVLGYVAGYFVIATVLMPLYYRLNLISIYGYLEERFGFWAYKTGAAFFLLSRTVGSSLRLYLAAFVLQTFVFDHLNVPFFITVTVTILLIWIYTFKGGIKTIVWTDTFQTFFLVSAVIVSVYVISRELGWNLKEMLIQVSNSDYSRVFFFDDFKSNNYFWKQFISGAFLAIVMTGLDQDLMQKNLSCKSLGDAQKNMFSFTIIMTIVNLLFLILGALLYIYTSQKGIEVPAQADRLFPTLAIEHFGFLVGIFFLLGIIASSYASSDSALAALTTSFCIDFLNFKQKPEEMRQKQKTYVHIGFSGLFLLIILFFREFHTDSVIKNVLTAASYTYGPLLGLFSFGILSKRKLRDRFTPYVCVAAPILTFLLTSYSHKLLWGYKFSFETLIVNGIICYLGLFLISYGSNKEEQRFY
ncbi:MAG: sodium:solute symporter [Cytophagaceae bacterium]